MRRISYTGTGQAMRSVLLGLLTSEEVLKVIEPYWQKSGLFAEANKEANLIGRWAVGYFSKYRKPIGRKVFDYFDNWQERNKDKTLGAMTDKLLQTLNAEFTAEEINHKFVLDQAHKLFTHVRQAKLIDALRAEQERPESTDGDFNAVLAEFSKPLLLSAKSGQAAHTGIAEAFSEQKNEVLVKYPGAAGEFFGDDLCRSGFVVFQAADKKGKTNWLMDVAWRAVLQRRKVMFFTVGDLTMHQVKIRFGVRAAKRPHKASPEVLIPTDMREVGGHWEVTHKAKSYTSALTAEEVERAWTDVYENKVKSSVPHLMIWEYPSDSCKASEVASVAMLNANQGWVPDVIVIDYVDLLAPENGLAETRDQIDVTWKKLNALRQELNCLVLTASQSNAAAYDVKLQRMNNFSGNKKKNAHATGIIGINQTNEEKGLGIQRLNWTVRREADFQENRTLVCAGCRPINNPCILSAYPKLEYGGGEDPSKGDA